MYEYTFVREIKKGSNYILVFGIQQKLEKNRHKWATKKKKINRQEWVGIRNARYGVVETTGVEL